MLSQDYEKLSDIFKSYQFKVEKDEVILLVKNENDSLFITAQINTKEGNISIKAGFLIDHGKSVSYDSTKVMGSEPNSYFAGNESFRPVLTTSGIIESEGKNWITQLNLSSKPDRIWLNTDFVWDFTFTTGNKKDAYKYK